MKQQLSTPTIICFGEMLWDVLPDGAKPGGAPMNVAYHLSKLGEQPAIISRIGDDSKGSQLLDLLKQWGLESSLVQIDNTYRTSEVIAKTNNKKEVSYEILYPVAWDFISQDQQTIDKVRSCKYLVYGSLASRNQVSMDALFSLLDTAAIKVLDINLRYPFVKRSILEPLMLRADIIKFNDTELDKVNAIFNGSYGLEAEKVRFIQDRFNIPEVLVTKGEFGASYYNGDSPVHYFGSKVVVQDTIGSGDAFLAAFLANHLAGADPKDRIKEACSLGGFVATLQGGCPAYSLNDYHDFKTLNQI